MKTWNRPKAIGQEFAANEYVSACTATIECDLPIPNDWYKLRINFPKPIPTIKGMLDTVVYNPCGEKHDVDVHGELIPITITHGLEYKGGPDVALEEPIECYFFAVYDEDGVLVNAHCTLTADGFQSNKS